MARLDQLDQHEAFDLGRSLNRSYTAEQFEEDWQRFVKLKGYILKRRARAEARKRLS